MNRARSRAAKPRWVRTLRAHPPTGTILAPAGGRKFDWVQVLARIVLAATLVALVVWQAGKYPGVRELAGSIAVTAVALSIAGSGLIAGLRRVRHLPSFVLRYAVGNLCRPGNQTKAVLFAVGIGTLFIITVRLRLTDLQSEYRLDLGSLTSDMFFIDIQHDQRAAAEAALARLGARDVRLAPVVRLRLVGLKWGPVHRNRENADLVEKRVGGEHRVSYRGELDASKSIVSGAFWPAAPASEPEVSVEEDQAAWMMLEVSDTLIFEILGRRIEARVSNIRRLERRVRSMSPVTQSNFLFRPGTLESAPHMFIGALKGPPIAVDRARLQNRFVEAFPNVTLIDALDEIQEIRNRIANLSVALSLLGKFVTAIGGSFPQIEQ